MPRDEDRYSFDGRAIGCGGGLIRPEPGKSFGAPPPEAVFVQGTEPDGGCCSVGLLSRMRMKLALGEERKQFSATLGGTCCNEPRSWKRIALANGQGPVRVSTLLKHPVERRTVVSRHRVLRDGSLHQAQADVQLHELVTAASRLARELGYQSLAD